MIFGLYLVNKTIETINRGIKELPSIRGGLPSFEGRLLSFGGRLPSFDLALRIVDKSNWIGKALVFPRALLQQVKARPELAQTGVYLLLGPRPDGEGDMLYVGEGDPIRPRLESHYAQKDFWTRAIGFTTTTAGQLNKGHVELLPSACL